jgi:putative aldouronate transport system substrate-binding protein
MKTRRTLTLLIILVTAFALLVGCAPAPTATGVPTNAPSPTPKPLDEYTIQMLFPGDTPVDMDLVVAEAEARVKDTLNVKLDVTFVPWSDYGNAIMTKLTAGEDFDLHLNAPWLSMQQLIDSSAIVPWDTLIESTMPNVKAKFDAEIMKNNMFNGKVMGIPLIDRIAAYGYVTSYRGDLAEAVGITDPILTSVQMNDYLYKVHAKFPELTPITWNGAQYLNGYVYDPTGKPIQTYMFGQNNCFTFLVYNEDGTVDPTSFKPIYEDPLFIAYAKHQRQLYLDGIIDKDVMAQTDMKGALIAGKTAMGMENFDEPKLQANVPGAYTVYTMPYKDTRKFVTDFKAWNFLCLNAKSQDPERVAMWYNWIYADQANYDLLALGIQDKHWVDKGNMTFDVPAGVDPNKNYSFPGYVLLWNPVFIKAASNWPASYGELHKVEMDSKYFVKSQLAGFNPDFKPVENEVAQISAVWAECIFTLGAGVLEDVDAGLATAKTKLEAAGYLTFVEEAKKQTAAFIAAAK